LCWLRFVRMFVATCWTVRAPSGLVVSCRELPVHGPPTPWGALALTGLAASPPSSSPRRRVGPWCGCTLSCHLPRPAGGGNRLPYTGFAGRCQAKSALWHAISIVVLTPTVARHGEGAARPRPESEIRTIIFPLPHTPSRQGFKPDASGTGTPSRCSAWRARSWSGC